MPVACKHGHPRAEHSYVNKRGTKVCRLCAARYQRDRYAKQRKALGLPYNPDPKSWREQGGEGKHRCPNPGIRRADQAGEGGWRAQLRPLSEDG